MGGHPLKLAANNGRAVHPPPFLLTAEMRWRLCFLPISRRLSSVSASSAISAKRLTIIITTNIAHKSILCTWQNISVPRPQPHISPLFWPSRSCLFDLPLLRALSVCRRRCVSLSRRREMRSTSQCSSVAINLCGGWGHGAVRSTNYWACSDSFRDLKCRAMACELPLQAMFGECQRS